MRSVDKFLKRGLIIAFVALCLTVVWLGLDAAASARAQSSTPTPAQLRLLQSDANRSVLELEVSGYTTESRNVGGVDYAVLSIPGLGSTGEPGKPQLPVQGTMIGVPPGAQASLKIVTDDSARVKLNAPPLPVPTQRAEYNLNRTSPQNVTEVYSPDPGTYSANRLYLADAVRIGTDGRWRSQRYLTVQFYPLQYNSATRELTFHRLLRVEIAFTYPGGQTREAMGGAVNEGPFEPTLQNMLLNYDAAKAWRAKTAAPGVSAAKPAYSGSPWYRIRVNADGMYKVSCAQLQAQGASPTLDPNTLKVFKQNNQMAIYQVWQSGDPCDANHYIVFWGQGLNTKYTDTNAYWLTYGGAGGKRMTARDGSGSPSASNAYSNTVHLEDNLYYLSTVPGNVEGIDHWYWMFLSSSPWTTNFSVSDLVTTTGYSATLYYDLAAITTGAHHDQIQINGYAAADLVWSGKGPFTGTVLFPVTYLTNTTNFLTVADAQPGSTSVVNSFDVAYPRAFVAMTDTLRFLQPTAGAWQYAITNFTTSTIQAFDITDPLNVVRIGSPTITQPDATYTYQFADDQPPAREYIALATPQYKTPASITLDTASDLKNTSNGADYIIIAYDGFVSNVQPLATFRQSQGLRVKVVAVQDIYDEFNDGVLDPQAIRVFLSDAYTSWTPPAPAMVLLVGDGHFDPRGYCVTPGKCPQDKGITTTLNTIFIPPPLRLVDTSHYESANDNYFVSFHDGTGDWMPQMALGRLPANSSAEVAAMVTKLLNYEQNSPAGTWRGRVSFVSDNYYDADGVPDSAGNFWAYSDAIASSSYYVPTSFKINRVYYNPCNPVAYPQCALPYSYYTTPDAVHTATLSAINDGSLIVNYVGHGSVTTWATHNSQDMLDVADVDTLTNGYKLPMMLEMTCDTGYYIHPTIPGLGEKEVRKAGAGALASWSATGWGLASGHDYLDRGFFEAIFHNGVRQIGPATVAGKAQLWANDPTQTDVMKMFVLLGDPASRLQVQVANYLPIILKK